MTELLIDRISRELAGLAGLAGLERWGSRTYPKPKHVGLDLASGPDRAAVTLRAGSRFICELEEGDVWTVYADTLVIVNPKHPPRFISLDTKDK